MESENPRRYWSDLKRKLNTRWASCLREGGRIIVNDRETDPMPVITGAATYPHEVLESLKAKGVLRRDGRSKQVLAREKA